MGRRVQLSRVARAERRRAMAAQWLAQGRRGVAQIARDFGCKRMTVYRALHEAGVIDRHADMAALTGWGVNRLMKVERMDHEW